MAETAQAEGMSFEQALALAMGEGSTQEVHSTTETMPSDEKVEAKVEPQVTDEPKAESVPAQPPAVDPIKALREEYQKEIAALKAKIESKPEAEVHTPRKTREVNEASLLADPIGTLKAVLGDKIDLKQLATDMFYDQLGDQAPAEYRTKQEVRSKLAKVDELEARIEEERREREQARTQAEQEQSYHQYIGALGNHVKAAVNAPLAKRLAETHPEMALQAMWQHAERIGHEQQRVPTPEEVTAALENELGRLKSVFGVADVPQKQEPAPVSQVPNTIRNEHTQVQAARAVPDENSDEFLREKAYREMEALLGRPISR